ncbi:hypothetical protein AMELA_G00060800 [Ameiurus melas]|uniref:Poly [ADP-ribose] polymerase n=1 Tax=Ameiurus melas TaxID=219545 RepID=A0A7J6B3K3_AMEME|nr:hypothetical protein AMELA_G00060800 [Ameiurus melas]
MEEYQHQLFVKYAGEEECKDLLKTFQKHFSLKGTSGGGDCCVFQISPNLFCVSFRSEQVRDRVLQQDQKILIANTEVAVTLSLQATVFNRKVDSLPLYKDQKEITNCEVCTEKIEIPNESVYSDLLEPHFFRKTIQEENTDVKVNFDPITRILQIKGTHQSVSSTKNEVYYALRRLKIKEIKIEPALIAYLKSIGSGNISRIFFHKADVHATVVLFSNISVVINGMSNYDINRAEKILKESTDSKEIQIPEEAASVIQTKNFENFVDDLRRNYSVHVNIALADGDDKKLMCILAGQKTELCSVEMKVQEFIKEQTRATAYMVLDEGMELTESLPLLLDRLGLSHISGCVKWNPDSETLELTGTNKAITEIKVAIEEKTKGLRCKTVTICLPGAFSYFKEDGQEFLNSLGTMLSCMAVLTASPGQVNLQAIPPFQANVASTGKGTGVCFHEKDKHMCLVAHNVIVQATASEKWPEFADIFINPLCQSTTDSKILNAAGAKVKTELRRTVQKSAITLTGPGQLPCRLLIHIPCLCGSQAKQYLKDVIQELQKRQFKSIAVFIDENELHQSFDQSRLSTDFIKTAMRYMDAEERMTIAFAQEGFFHCFKNTAKSIYGQLSMMRNKGCLSNPSEKNDLESLHRHSDLCEPAIIHIFSKKYQLLEKAKAAIEKHYAAFLSTDLLVQPFLHTCGEQVLRKICQLQQKHAVNVIICDGTVLFNGLTIKTSIAQEEASTIINEAIVQRVLEHKRKVLQAVQWVIKNEEEGTAHLSCEDNYNIEVQYMYQRESVDVKHANETFTVNVTDMTAISKDTSQEHSLQRTEMIVKEFPGKWNITENENFKKVKIDRDSLEYVAVERRFNETSSSKTINKIERIENKTLWKRFTLDISGEVKLLFYGLKHADVEQVEKTGFFRPPETFFSSENAYGRGIYFYVDASSAQRRCDVNSSRQKVMFLGRAETGIFTVGRKGINVPPAVDASNPGILYHSVVDNKDSPTVFVVFSSDRTYPEYCITFTD